MKMKFEHMKTINEIQIEVQKIINDHPQLEDRLNALKASGYTGITFSWLKCSGIGRVFYLKRKHLYRIQVGPTEIRGKYPITYCVEIPAMDR